jgi:hypothetical protein
MAPDTFSASDGLYQKDEEHSMNEMVSGWILFGVPALLWCAYWLYVLKSGRALDERILQRHIAAEKYENQ